MKNEKKIIIYNSTLPPLESAQALNATAGSAGVAHLRP